jgi:hypothetical protein
MVYRRNKHVINLFAIVPVHWLCAALKTGFSDWT